MMFPTRLAAASDGRKAILVERYGRPATAEAMTSYPREQTNGCNFAKGERKS